MDGRRRTVNRLPSTVVGGEGRGQGVGGKGSSRFFSILLVRMLERPCSTGDLLAQDAGEVLAYKVETHDRQDQQAERHQTSVEQLRPPRIAGFTMLVHLNIVHANNIRWRSRQG